MASENGWEPLHPSADQLEWVTVPGTDVHLQFLKGQPLTILRAFAADFNAYVEPLRDADSAAYTATNSVATSNHLNGTAMDLNWNTHPFRVLNAGFDATKIATCRELLAFYENTVWWGNDWNSPKDAMHWNMGYDTYGAENVGRVQDFINRKIRADGFSTFRRGGTVTPPPPVVNPGLSRADGYAVRIIAEGRRRGITPRGIQIALATALVESNITVYANEKLPKSLALPHDAVGRDGLSVGIFQQQVKDTGNGWWWGDEATCMGVESSAGLFYDRLVKRDYNNGDPGTHAQAIQQSAFPTRYAERFGEAVALYNRLANTAPVPAPPAPGDDDMSAGDVARLERKIDVLVNEWGPSKKGPSRSFMAVDGNPVESPLGFLYNADGNIWSQQLTWAYLFDVPLAVQVVEKVATSGTYDGSWVQSESFNAWLSEFGQEYCRGLVSFKKALVSKLALSNQPSSGVVNNVAGPSATEIASAVAAVIPPQDTSVYAENARLREENTRLQLEADSHTALAVRETDITGAKTSGDRVGAVVDSMEDFITAALEMNPKQRDALTRALNAIELSKGSKA